MALLAVLFQGRGYLNLIIATCFRSRVPTCANPAIRVLGSRGCSLALNRELSAQLLVVLYAPLRFLELD